MRGTSHTRRGMVDDAQDTLRRSARLALRRYGTEGWYVTLLNRAVVVLRNTYRTETGLRSSPELTSAVGTFTEAAARALEQTTTPDELTAVRLSTWLATMAVNAGVDASATDTRSVKTWRTRGDHKVRQTHRDAEGQSVPVGEPFMVAETPMDYPGQPVGDPALWLACRCSMDVSAEQDVLAASGNTASIGIFAIPAKGDPVYGISSEPTPHVTLVYFGDAATFTGDLGKVEAAVRAVAARHAPVTETVVGRDTLGDDRADVLLIEPTTLGKVRDALLANEDILAGHEAIKQYPSWTPHLTAGYPDRPARSSDVPPDITFDTLALWVGDENYEHPLGGTMDDELTPWYGVLAPEGVMSGDGRQFEPGSLRFRDLPLPLSWQKVNDEGHDGSVVVGRIDTIVREDGVMRARGVMLATPEAKDVMGLMSTGALRGVSVDVDDATMELRTPDGRRLSDGPEEGSFEDYISAKMHLTDGRIAGATLCAIPAFQEACLFLGEEDVALVFAISEAPWDGSSSGYTDEQWYDATLVHLATGEDRLVKANNKLPIYTPSGDLSRAGVHSAAGRVNQVDAPSAKIAGAKAALRRAYSTLGEELPDSLKATCAPAFRLLVASAAPLPAQWFENPALTGPTPLTITDDGRVFGHMAIFGTCHNSWADVCIMPPHSMNGYASFRTGAVRTTDGLVPVGQITLVGGHAPELLAPGPARAHYDDTGSAVADIATGDDEYGIWVAGALRSTATDEQVHVLLASPLSGDWRRIGGHLELIAALSVNVQGFTVPRIALAASGGEQISLVGSGGMLPTRVSHRDPRFVAEVTIALEKIEAARARKAKMTALAIAAGRDNRSRMAVLRERG